MPKNDEEQQVMPEGSVQVDFQRVVRALQEEISEKSEKIAILKAINGMQEDEIVDLRKKIDTLSDSIPKDSAKTTKEKK